jgi:hypothetical protein
MGTRFIHKNGKVIPLHSDHGDQQSPGAEHAAPMNPPKTPAPMPGKEDVNHPEARPAAPTAPAAAAPVAEKPVAEAAPTSVAVPKMKKGKPC